ncbi:acyl-CoA thioesterase [Aureibacter tunicatorum]|uniref:Acyl-CoA thioester hydrolase n=1 Tax=Aureibacter tunicatorum TaxID=866807 RepID=A0AAE3XNW7_9BACT|nr:acyl-CoA thioesterase [Aureibacter tunicatorum]MDR6239221.1 acyl-CoA thioester hydrolase [Aureibacter tunicatorum]BDD04854.1 thioesterase [Aureibacter tunicatorum]
MTTKEVLQKITESKSIIRFQDCDPFAHLNNAKYLDYFFNAREDQVPKLYGFNIADIFQEFKAAWVVYQHHIAYVKPAMFGEWVNIYSRIVNYDENTVVVEYYMTDEKGKDLKCLLWTTFKFVELKTGKKSTHPDKVENFLKKVYYNIGFTENPININDRVKEIKNELASS